MAQSNINMGAIQISLWARVKIVRYLGTVVLREICEFAPLGVPYSEQRGKVDKRVVVHTFLNKGGGGVLEGGGVVREW